MLLLLSRQQRLRVGAIARLMKLSRPAASQYLRALEGCGFVRARRIRRTVVYDLAPDKASMRNGALTEALMSRLATAEDSLEAVFKLATTFANPGRIEVFRSLAARPKSPAELKSELGWSRWTVWRHLQKLENRGFVRQREGHGTYERTRVTDEFGCALARAAQGA